jgi:hypothetical protein
MLYNDEQTSDQIDLFLSLVRLPQFNRLHSLTLLNIDESQLNVVLKQINHNLLTSFSFSIRKYDRRRMKTTNNLLESILTHPTLRQLEFDITPKRMSKISWPLDCPIQYLTVNSNISIDNLFTILQCSPYLHTIIIKNTLDFSINNGFTTCSSRVSFRQLTSLIIEQLNITVDKLESFLSLTPSLVHLKLIGRIYMLDGKRWEQFIEMNLPQLDKFEFCFDGSNIGAKTLADFDLIIASFRTPFWTEHKKWFVTYEYNIFGSMIHLYSIPICKTSLRYEPKYNRVSPFTCVATTENESTIMNNVKSLSVVLDKAIANNINKKVCYLTKSIS